MFGISGEHLLILGIVLIFFGPKRLPELGNTLGKAIRNFKDSLSGVEEASFRKIIETPNPNPAQNSVPPAVQTAQAAPAQPIVHTDGPTVTSAASPDASFNPDGSKKT
ncbi:MAG: twin-arginine translocase TatA/TatE family subunit [Methylotenera sp.]|nr:twin-arginine translocase TatA/TatE family subunit [Oligoflexia bacterium]